MRRLALAFAVALVAVPAAGAKDGVRATLTSPLPKHAAMGTKLVVTFTLRDADGHPFNAERVFVKIICPTKDASTIAFASRAAHVDGRYRVVATVPSGGLGTIRIGLRGSTDIYFPIKNH
ncbi:MAG TPA: hypothetical protein VN770_00680 [Gaiellaceae bacterium]|nr:hypothetical protein [Gaiellaceae bacterium]